MSDAFYFSLLTLSVCVVVCVSKAFRRLSRRSNVLLNGSYFHGKTVLITGASSGLGRALAFELSKINNIQLILASRDTSLLEEISETLSNDVQRGKPVVFALDLGDSRSVEEFSQKIWQRFPRGVDVLVNNAGVSVRADCFSTDMKVHRRLMEVNYFGHIQLTQALFHPTLSESADQGCRKRTIVCISSVQGRIALPNRSAYSASKHAFNAYFDSLKAELAVAGCKNINVLTVNAGYIDTNLSRNALKSDGSLSGKSDENQKRGMNAVLAADHIIQAMIDERSELILADFKSRLAILLRVLCPKLYFYSVVKRASREN